MNKKQAKIPVGIPIIGQAADVQIQFQPGPNATPLRLGQKTARGEAVYMIGGQSRLEVIAGQIAASLIQPPSIFPLFTGRDPETDGAAIIEYERIASSAVALATEVLQQCERVLHPPEQQDNSPSS